MWPLLQFCRKAMLSILVVLLVARSFCQGGSVEVTGAGECADCQLKNIKAIKAFNGLRVTIDCRLAHGEMHTRGTGELDKQGNFRVVLPEEIVQDGKLKEECYAKLHGASNTPCPAHDDIDSSKIIFVSKSEDGKNIFSTARKIKFSSETCVSAFHWPLPKYPPPFPQHPWFKKPFPFPKPFPQPCPPSIAPLPPPVPVTPKPLPPPVPVTPKPLPPPVPVTPKPLPPPVPVTPKPLPPPVPVTPKPLPPPVPVAPKPSPKPCPEPEPKPKPFPKPFPPFPYHKPFPPFPYHKPLPPFPYHKPLPPIPYHKPLPPFPYHKPLPPFPYHKPWPKIKYPPVWKPKFPEHPKKYWPPLPFVPPHA